MAFEPRWIAAVGLALSSALLALACFGPRLPPRDLPEWEDRPTPVGSIAGYDRALRKPCELLRLLGGPRAEPPIDPRGAAEDLRALTRLVHETLEHGEPRLIGWGDNWLARLSGLVWKDLRVTQRPERLARGGRGLCSDAANVFVAAARKAGFEAEVLDLNGHLIARARACGDEWVVDPDYGLVFEQSLAELETPAGLARVVAAARALGHTEDRLGAYVDALGSPDDNRVLPGDVLSPRLARLEHALDQMAWLLPLAVGLACWGYLRRRRSTGLNVSTGSRPSTP